MADNMNGDSKKYVHYAGAVFLFAASCAIFWQILGPSWFRNIHATVTSQPNAREITVSADGKINATPDIALLSFSVVSQGNTVKAVTKDGNSKMTSVIAAIKKLGVDDKDVVTTQYSLNPNYKYPEGGTATISGYSLTQEISVKVRKLDAVEDVLDAGVKAGSNQVGSISFDIDDASAYKKQAREKAFATAKEKAQEMANAAGVKLGRVVTFTESSDPVYPMYRNFSMKAESAAMDAGAPASIEAGSKDLQISVSVTYEIE